MERRKPLKSGTKGLSRTTRLKAGTKRLARTRLEPATPGAKTATAQRSKPLRARDPRRAGYYKDRAAACAAALTRDGHRCQAAQIIPGHQCAGPIDPQHVIPEGVRRDLGCDPDNIIALCRSAHDGIKDDILAAWEYGIHGYSWDDVGAATARRQRHHAAALRPEMPR